MPTEDPHYLERFVTAQSSAYHLALAELKAGRKRTHWMWFIFPLARGLGRTSTSEFFGIASLEEARAYLAHPVLGHRLWACTAAALEVETPSLNALFGSPDDLKFVSSMSLFQLAAGDPDPFQKALDRWNGGRIDPRTAELMGHSPELTGRAGLLRVPSWTPR